MFNNIEFGIMSGLTQFYGDIKQFDFRPSYSRFFDEIKPSYEISISKKINPLLSLKGSFITENLEEYLKRLAIIMKFMTHTIVSMRVR